MNDPLQQLVDYIKHHLQSGTPEPEIRQTLQDANWHADYIEHGLSAAKTQLQPELPEQQETVNTATQAQEQLPAQTNHVSTSQPQKYTVFRAVAESAAAIKYNFLTFSLAAIIALLAPIVGLAIGFAAIAIVFSQIIGPFSASTIFGPAFIILFVLMLVWNAAFYAFYLATTAIGFATGAERQKLNVKATLAQAGRSIWKVVRAEIIIGVVAIAPLVVCILIGLALQLFGMERLSIMLLPIGMLIGGLWMLIAFLRYALLPYVALFEEPVSVRKGLQRSYHLIRNGGIWFLVKGYILMLILLFLLSAVSGVAVDELRNTSNTVALITMAVMSLFINGALTMLYRNRAAVRGAEATS